MNLSLNYVRSLSHGPDEIKTSVVKLKRQSNSLLLDDFVESFGTLLTNYYYFSLKTEMQTRKFCT